MLNKLLENRFNRYLNNGLFISINRDLSLDNYFFVCFFEMFEFYNLTKYSIYFVYGNKYSKGINSEDY